MITKVIFDKVLKAVTVRYMTCERTYFPTMGDKLPQTVLDFINNELTTDFENECFKWYE